MPSTEEKMKRKVNRRVHVTFSIFAKNLEAQALKHWSDEFRFENKTGSIEYALLDQFC